MVLHHARKSGSRGDGADPAGQLAVPHKSVTTDGLSVCLRKADQGIGVAEAEAILRGLGGIPLHGVLGADLAELGLDDVRVRAAGEKSGISGCAEVLALGLGLSVEGAGTSGGSRGGDSGRCGRSGRRGTRLALRVIRVEYDAGIARSTSRGTRPANTTA